MGQKVARALHRAGRASRRSAMPASGAQVPVYTLVI